MIIIKIMGGLGNQMFQYALARSLIERGKDVKLDVSYYDHIPTKDTYRALETDKFIYKIPKASKREIKLYNNIIQKIMNKINMYIRLFPQIKIIEEKKDFCEEVFECDNKYLIGYWQNENYFKDIKLKLIQDFGLAPQNAELAQRLQKEKNSVSLHIRAGDYLNQYNYHEFGNICTQEYYEKACNYIENQIRTKIKVYVFTNDAQWAEKNIKLKRDGVKYIDWNEKEDSRVDLYLMSLCHHNIIANSSYSWWAAWLNMNQGRIVVAPFKWSNNSRYEDVYCADWVKVKQYD